MNVREQVFQILQRIEREDAFSTPLLEGRLTDDRDGGFVRTIVLGVLRWRNRLDYVIGHLAKRSVSRIDPPALIILRIGLYQLMYMKVPPWAAVSESVDLARRHSTRAAGFVNGVLRAASRTDPESILPSGPSEETDAIRTGHPEWLLRRWKASFGSARAMRIAEADQDLSYPDLLVNLTKISMDAAERLLESRQVEFQRSALVPNVLRLRSSTAPLAAEIEAGLMVAMDEGSAVIANLASDGSGVLLDLAAAPGGKSLAIRMTGRRVVSHDVSPARLRIVKRAAERMFGEHAMIVAGDGTRPPFGRRFETVLLDAPCSATGTIRKHPELKWRLTESKITACSLLQRRLLDSALDLCENRLVYSTCSLESEENDHVIQEVLKRRSDFRPFRLGTDSAPTVQEWLEDGVLRLTPDSGSDGFTAFGLERV